MSTLEAWLVSCLWNSVWQVPLLFVAGLLASRVVRACGAVPEHRVWVTVLLLQAAIPGLSSLTLPWLDPMAWTRWIHGTGTQGLITVQIGPGTVNRVWSLPAALLMVVAVFYSACILFAVSRFAWRYRQVRALRATASAVTGVGQDLALLKATWEHHRTRFGLERVELATSSRARVPMVLGWRHPLIVLPSSLLHDLPQEELCTVLAHECAHVQRHDFAWNLLYEVATFLVAYHPLLWATRARVAESREWVCDETACHEAAGTAPYARSLLRLASILLGDEPAAYSHAIGMFGANSLERRLMYLTRKQSRPMGARRVAIAVACASIALGTCGSAWAWRTKVAGPAVDVGSQTAEGTGNSVKVSGGVMAGQLLTKVNPVYPRDARDAKIQGSVKLSAVIGKDGAIQSLTVTSGPVELQRAAIDAVRQWTYKPFLLNGDPVAVDTIITVNFQLQP